MEPKGPGRPAHQPHLRLRKRLTRGSQHWRVSQRLPMFHGALGFICATPYFRPRLPMCAPLVLIPLPPVWDAKPIVSGSERDSKYNGVLYRWVSWMLVLRCRENQQPPCPYQFPSWWIELMVWSLIREWFSTFSQQEPESQFPKSLSQLGVT